MKVFCFAEDPKLLEGDAVYLAAKGDERIKLHLKNSGGKHWIAAVDGVAERNAAELLRGKSLWIDRGTLPEPEEDEFYFEDLIGLSVVDLNGVPAGEITSVQNFGAEDMLEIKPAGEASYYLPFTKKAVPEIDIAAKLVKIDPEQRII